MKVITYLKRLFRKIKARRKSPLPMGVAEFNSWAEDILDLYGMPINDTNKGVLAVMIMHLGPQDDFKSKEFFGKAIRKGAANEIAHYVFQDIKKKQQAAAEATTAGKDLPAPVATDETKH